MRNPFVLESGNYKTSYRSDMKIFRTPYARLRVFVLIALVLLAPFLVSNYVIGLLTLCAIASIGAIGLNILTGFTGQISIGVGAFLGVGGYTSVILTRTFGVSFCIAFDGAGLRSVCPVCLF